MSNSLKILVVDDDADAADSLGELFEMEGHDVTVAYDGNTAVEAYDKASFDIAFMDIMMPGKNGVESFFEIRKNYPDAKVFMMTGFSVEQLIQQAIDHGAMGVLSKPVDLDKVLSVIDDIKPAGVVLIAEDDPDFGPQLQTVIETSGYTCQLVKTGADALERVKSGGVDILILDLNLPIIDGIEVYTSLKNHNKEVPTIIITGQSAEVVDHIDILKDVSVTGVLNKPFDPNMLLERLDELQAA